MTIRTTLAAITAAAAIAVTGCAAPQGDYSSASTTATSTTARALTDAPSPANEAAVSDASTYKAPSLDEIAERAFLNTVSDYQSPSNEASLMVGRATCTLLDGGSTPDTLAYELLLADEPVVPGFLNDELPHFYGAAMGSLCPEYGERFFG